MKDTRSKELYERAKVHIPGGVNSPVRAFRAVNRTPRFMESAKGDRIIDADGNEYIDYVCSWGPGILGHAHPQVIKKVMDSCENGLTFGAPTEKEVILAELLFLSCDTTSRTARKQSLLLPNQKAVLS